MAPKAHWDAVNVAIHLGRLLLDKFHMRRREEFRIDSIRPAPLALVLQTGGADTVEFAAYQTVLRKIKQTARYIEFSQERQRLDSVKARNLINFLTVHFV